MEERILVQQLADLPLGEIHFFNELPSTNRTAMEGITRHPPEYSLFAADHQTAGYGRNQRAWFASAGASLSFSLILYPTQQELQVLPLFSALASVAVCTALERCFSSEKAQIKWPNDVLLDEKKCTGILCESRWQGPVNEGLVMGIGINIRSAAVPPETELLFPATCLEDALDVRVDRWEFLHVILEQLLHHRRSFPSSTFIQTWQNRLAFRGQVVTLTSNDEQQHQGIMQGVDEQGLLVIQEKSGRQLHFSLGDVSLRPG